MIIGGTKTVEEELVEAGIGVGLIRRGLVVSEAMIKLEVRTVREVYKKNFAIEKDIIPVEAELVLPIRAEFVRVDIL